MTDTIFVATNAIPDTLKLVLESTDNGSFIFQLITLIIALVAVITGPYIQLKISDRQRKTDIGISRNKLIWEITINQKKWLKDFTHLIYNLQLEISKLHNNVISNKQITPKHLQFFFDQMNLIILLCDEDKNTIKLIDNVKEIAAIDYGNIITAASRLNEIKNEIINCSLDIKTNSRKGKI